VEYIFREGMGAKRVVRVWVRANVAVLGGLVERREEGGEEIGAWEGTYEEEPVGEETGAGGKVGCYCCEHFGD
jgi:hypothetical protein